MIPSIDGSKSQNPRAQLLDTFREVQKDTLRHVGDVEYCFGEEFEITKDSSDKMDQVALYDLVRAWFDSQGARPPMKKAVLETARKLGVEIKMHSNKPIYCGIRKRPQ